MKRKERGRRVSVRACAVAGLLLQAVPGAGVQAQERAELDAGLAMVRDAAVRFDARGLMVARDRIQPLMDEEATAAEASYGVALAEYASLVQLTFPAYPLEETRRRVDRALRALGRALELDPTMARALALESLARQMLTNVRQSYGEDDPTTRSAATDSALALMDTAVARAPDDPHVASARALLLSTIPTPEAQAEAAELLQETLQELRRLPEDDRELAAGWLPLMVRYLRTAQLLGADRPEEARILVRETLALEPDFRPVRRLAPTAEALVAAAKARYRSVDVHGLEDLAWVELARDPSGDGNAPDLPDATALSWALGEARVWFRFELDDAPPDEAFGMNLVLDLEEDAGQRWWGENPDVRWDRLVTAWLERGPDGAYRGTMGLGDPQGRSVMNLANLRRGDLAFALLPSALVLGVPREWLPAGEPFSLLGAVGSNRSWNDDVPGSGAVRLTIPPLDEPGPTR